MEEELSVLRHQVEALSAAHRAAQLEAQQMAERNAAMARQISDLASAPSDGEQHRRCWRCSAAGCWCCMHR